MAIRSVSGIMMPMLFTLSVQTTVADLMTNLPKHADLDDTTLGQQILPSRKDLGKEEDEGGWAWVSNILSQGGATPLASTNPQANARGVRVREEKVQEAGFFDKLFAGEPKQKTSRKAVPSQGYVPPQVVGVRPPSMFRSSMVRAPLVGLIAFFVGSITTYVWLRPDVETSDHQPLLSA